MWLDEAGDREAGLAQFFGIELQGPEPRSVDRGGCEAIDLEDLLDATGLEVRRRDQAVGGLVTFGVLVVEAWMQHQDDETAIAAKNPGELADRLAH